MKTESGTMKKISKLSIILVATKFKTFKVEVPACFDGSKATRLEMLLDLMTLSEVNTKTTTFGKST